MTPLRPDRGRAAITGPLHGPMHSLFADKPNTRWRGRCTQSCPCPMPWDHRCLCPELVPHHNQMPAQGQTQSWGQCSPPRPRSSRSSQPNSLPGRGCGFGHSHATPRASRMPAGGKHTSPGQGGEGITPVKPPQLPPGLLLWHRDTDGSTLQTLFKVNPFM